MIVTLFKIFLLPALLGHVMTQLLSVRTHLSLLLAFVCTSQTWSPANWASIKVKPENIKIVFCCYMIEMISVSSRCSSHCRRRASQTRRYCGLNTTPPSFSPARWRSSMTGLSWESIGGDRNISVSGFEKIDLQDLSRWPVWLHLCCQKWWGKNSSHSESRHSRSEHKQFYQ